MKRNILIILSIAIGGLCFASCSDGDDVTVLAGEPTLTLNTETIDVPVDGGTYTIELNSNTEWSASVRDVPEWCDVSPALGKGDGTLTITVSENRTLDELAAVVSVWAGTVERQVLLVQNPMGLLLEALPASIDATALRGTYTIELKANGRWIAREDAYTEWCTIEPSSGEGNATITVTARDNYLDERSGNIIISVDGESVSVGIDQREYIGMEIGGTIWALSNVDTFGTFATAPDEMGMFYQFNNPEAYSNENKLPLGWNSSTDFATTDWLPENDPCPKGWRIPTATELLTLYNDSDIWWRYANPDDNRVNGYFMGPEGSGETATIEDPEGCIFLPAAGYRNYTNGQLGMLNGGGYYWSSTQQEPERSGATYMYCNHEGYSAVTQSVKTYALSLRCVKKQG